MAEGTCVLLAKDNNQGVRAISLIDELNGLCYENDCLIIDIIKWMDPTIKNVTIEHADGIADKKDNPWAIRPVKLPYMPPEVVFENVMPEEVTTDAEFIECCEEPGEDS